MSEHMKKRKSRKLRKDRLVLQTFLPKSLVKSQKGAEETKVEENDLSRGAQSSQSALFELKKCTSLFTSNDQTPCLTAGLVMSPDYLVAVTPTVRSDTHEHETNHSEQNNNIWKSAQAIVTSVVHTVSSVQEQQAKEASCAKEQESDAPQALPILQPVLPASAKSQTEKKRTVRFEQSLDDNLRDDTLEWQQTYAVWLDQVLLGAFSKWQRIGNDHDIIRLECTVFAGVKDTSYSFAERFPLSCNSLMIVNCDIEMEWHENHCRKSLESTNHVAEIFTQRTYPRDDTIVRCQSTQSPAAITTDMSFTIVDSVWLVPHLKWQWHTKNPNTNPITVHLALALIGAMRRPVTPARGSE